MVTELIKPLYTAEATAVGGRDGHATEQGRHLDVDIKPPVEMGGPGGGHQPRGAVRRRLRRLLPERPGCGGPAEKVSVDGSTVTGKVTIGTIEGGGFGLAVDLEVHIPEVDAATTTSLIEAAHQVCPYSNATRGNIAVTLTAV